MNNLKWLRKQKGLTQEELAVIARVSSKTIRRVEGGEYNFGVESAKRLATFFRCKRRLFVGVKHTQKHRYSRAYR